MSEATSITAMIEVLARKAVTANFDPATNTLTLTSENGEHIGSFNGDVVDSGALVDRLPQGEVVLPLSNENYPHIAQRLKNAGVVELGKTWSTYGGTQFVAARVLI